MFTLIESTRAVAAERSWGGSVFSFAVHSALAAAAVLATRQGPPAAVEDRPAPTLVWNVPRREDAPPPLPGRPSLPGTPAPPSVPVFDPGAPLVPPELTPDPGVTAAWPVSPGVTPVIGGSREPGPGAVHDNRYVEEPPARLDHPPLRYPEILRQAGIEGTVIVEAVLDTLGAVEPASVRLLQRAHALFEAEAVTLVRGSRYRAGRVNGRPVRVRIQVPVVFAIRR